MSDLAVRLHTRYEITTKLDYLARHDHACMEFRRRFPDQWVHMRSELEALADKLRTADGAITSLVKASPVLDLRKAIALFGTELFVRLLDAILPVGAVRNEAKIIVRTPAEQA